MRAPCLSFVCPLRWSELFGAGSICRCGHCFREAHELSAVGPVRAAALLRRAETEPLCVRVRQAAGQVVLAAALLGGAGGPGGGSRRAWSSAPAGPPAR